MKVSAVIIAFNEEAKIARALDSVAWADETVVVDSESTDRTREICLERGARVIVRPWHGFSEQKQFAAESAANDWILSIDADEAVTEGLRDEIAAIGADADAAGYRIPRLSYYMGRPVTHCGWYPDRQLRLFDRRRGRWNGRVIHESVAVDGKVADLKSDLLHFSVDDARHHHRMIGERYAPLAAEQMFLAGGRTSPLRIATAGAAAFVRSYFLKLGFLDGLPGFAISRFAAHHAFLKHLMLWELQRSEK